MRKTRKLTDEHKMKISIANKEQGLGRKLSDEHKAAMSAAAKKRWADKKKGKYYSCEICGEMQYRAPHLVKLIEAGKKRVFCKLHRPPPCGNRGRTKGFHHSDETKAKMSAAQKGKKRPPRSAQWKANQSTAIRAWWEDPENRKKKGKEFPCANPDCSTMVYKYSGEIKRIEAGVRKVYCSQTCRDVLRFQQHMFQCMNPSCETLRFVGSLSRAKLIRAGKHKVYCSQACSNVSQRKREQEHLAKGDVSHAIHL